MLAGEQRELPIIITINKRSNKIILKPSIEGIKITVPNKISIPIALKFSEEKRGWIERQLSKKQPINLANIDKITFLDKEYDIKSTQEKLGTQIIGNTIYVSGAPEFKERRLNDFLKKELLAYIEDKVKFYSKQLCFFRRPKRIALKTVSTRHGSCSATGNLCFSDKLIYAPCYVIDYVVAHEVSHLKEMNHSISFWKLCDKLYKGDIDQAKTWLKVNL